MQSKRGKAFLGPFDRLESVVLVVLIAVVLVIGREFGFVLGLLTLVVICMPLAFLITSWRNKADKK
jgi:hypothetical protein